jgi:uncharacterized protein (TIGR02147 family)
MSLGPPNIFEFESYRQFLKAHYDFKRALNPSFSFSVLSRMLGFKARSTLQLVIAGRRNLSQDAIPKFRSLFQKKPAQFAYFRDLVLFEQSRDPIEKARLAGELEKKLKGQVLPGAMALQLEQYRFYSQWYFPLISMLPCLGPLKGEPKEVVELFAFPLTEREAQKAIEFMLEAGIWTRTPEGTIVLTNKLISSAQAIDRVSLKRFHVQMLEKATLAADFPFAERYLSGNTMAIPSDKLEAVYDELDAFKRELTARYSPANATPDTVYHLGINFFPVAKKPSPKDPSS